MIIRNDGEKSFIYCSNDLVKELRRKKNVQLILIKRFEEFVKDQSNGRISFEQLLF